jgi:hypothetical protein
MAVYVSNLVINAGADFNQSFTLESYSNNSPLNLIGYTISSQLRKHSGSSNYIDFNSEIVNSTAGQIQIGLASSITSTIRPGRYVYDIVVTNYDGLKSRVVEGMVLVREGATK